MIVEAKYRLYELIARLSDEDAVEALTYIEQLVAEGRTLQLAADGGPLQPHELPSLHQAPVVTNADELRGDIFPPEESADEFLATIRRWRDAGQPE